MDKSFVSAYDVYMQPMADFPKDKLDVFADDSMEFDMSFVEKCHRPAINTTIFPNTPNACWSSSPYVNLGWG